MKPSNTWAIICPFATTPAWFEKTTCAVFKTSYSTSKKDRKIVWPMRSSLFWSILVINKGCLTLRLTSGSAVSSIIAPRSSTGLTWSSKFPIYSFKNVIPRYSRWKKCADFSAPVAISSNC